MKDRVPDACKGSIPYYAFICGEATEGLRAYLKERKERFGNLNPEEPLFCSEWTLWKTQERVLQRPAQTFSINPFRVFGDVGEAHREKL
ncbi:MAG: hypothetical protein ACP5E9_03865 [Candidatus Methanospirareceae archaeon]